MLQTFYDAYLPYIEYIGEYIGEYIFGYNYKEMVLVSAIEENDKSILTFILEND